MNYKNNDKPDSFLKKISFFNLLSLPIKDSNVELRSKLRKIEVFYWACMVFAPYFIAEQSFTYQTQRYFPVLIPLYGVLALAPILFRKSTHYRLYAGYIVTLGITLVILLIAYEGGNRSPGAFWLMGVPLIFGLFNGTQGVWVGTAVMAGTFLGFIGLNYWGLLPNLVAEHGDYEEQKLINLIGFAIYNVLISYYFINTEEKAQRELRVQKQETEDLLRILVHDIANPINAIQLMTHAVKSGRKDPEEILGLVDGALEDLAGIVQQVRKLRALKDGKLALALSHVSIQAALADTINLLAQQAQHKGVALQLDIDSTPAFVVTDLALLKSIIFANIINNAIKFSYPGQAVSIRLTVSPAWVTLVVEDHGIGIPDDLLPYIFDPAQPTTRPGTSGEQGTGFGMPLVKTLLAKLNGEIELESNQDSGTSGTVVTVRLPRTIESL